MTYGRSGTSAYQSIATHGGVSAADPHRLVLMLLDGALARVAQARGCDANGEKLEATLHVQKALAIVGELKAALDLSQGEIARNLDSLYDYICRLLLVAHIPTKRDVLPEVSQLLGEIRAAWAAIPAAQRNPPNSTARPSP